MTPTHRTDPRWLAARQDYVREVPDETAAAALVRRARAALAMYEIEAGVGARLPDEAA